jgi:hypothetical protein
MDIEAFFEGLEAGLAGTPGGRAVERTRLRPHIEARVGPIVAENTARAADDLSRRNLWLTAMLLAAYRELRERGIEAEPAVDLIRQTLMTIFRPEVLGHLRRRFDIDPEHPDRAFEQAAANFLARGESGFGSGFTYEQEVQTERQSFVNVTRCFFLDFLRANRAPELTPALCALDMVWADELNRGPYNVSFERPTLMSRGEDKCRFQFTRTDPG